MVAAILHLGNIDFIKGDEVDSSKLKDDKSCYHLQTSAELLMLELNLIIWKDLNVSYDAFLMSSNMDFFFFFFQV